MYKLILGIGEIIIASLFLLCYPVVIFLKPKRQKPVLFWGTDPLISFSIWSRQMKAIGYESYSFMSSVYSINNKEDFDIFYDDFLKSLRVNKIFNIIRTVALPYYLFLRGIYKYDIFHHPFNGIFLQQTILKNLEPRLLRNAGCKSVALPYGSDIFCYSKLDDLSLRHGLLLSYPQLARKEKEIDLQVQNWVVNSDIVIPVFQVDNMGRWDILAPSILSVDTSKWNKTTPFNLANGVSGTVFISHAPNHRGVKGSEFVAKAVKALQEEGYKVELVLLEKITNQQVLEVLSGSIDIHVDQIVGPGYAMSAIEALSLKLPVVANLTNERYMSVFRRYSFLNECPIVGGNHENLVDVLRSLVENPDLRYDLGMAGRAYVEKYHSSKSSQYLFENIYRKIWYKKDIDLMNMYHPLNSASFNNQSAVVNHPLVNSNIPEKMLAGTQKHV
jgi:hypothetical protein